MSRPSDNRAPMTASERTAAWRNHMFEVLKQNPVYAGCTVIMLHHGRTHRFKIPSRPIHKS